MAGYTGSLEGQTSYSFVPPNAYFNKDNHLSLRGTHLYLTVVSEHEGQVDVHVHLEDSYFRSPDDENRSSPCMHQCGQELADSGEAKEFRQHGDTVITIATQQPLASREAASTETAEVSDE